MATDVERLVVSLEASAKKFENAMSRAVGVTNNSMRSVERRTEQATQRVERAFSGIGTRIKTGLAGVFAGISVQQVAQLADSFTKVQNSLKVAGLEGENLRKTYEAVYAISQRQGAPLEAMAQLYGRVAQSQKELNATGAEVLRMTEGVGMALRIQGTSAEAASGALLQLGQLLGSNRVMGDEFNGVMEGARPILQAVAAGMEEAGGSVSKLKNLVNDGKVSGQAFFRAFLAGMPLLEQKAASANLTMAQGWGKARDAMINLIGKLDESVGASEQAGQGFNNVAVAIEGIAGRIPAAVDALTNLQAKMAEVGNSSVFKRIYEGLNAAGLGGMNGVEDLNRFDQVFGNKVSAGSMAGYKPGATAAKAATITPIKAADFPVGGDDDKKGKKERLNDLQREIKQIQERTRALDSERQTVGMSAGDAAKAEAAFRLLEAAKEANVAVTPQLKAQIDSLAAAYGEATQKIEDAEKAQDAVADAAREVGGMLSDAFTDAILEGEKLDEIGRRLLKTFASKAFDNIFASLFSTAPGSGGLGGMIGNLFKGIFAPGRAVGGSVSAGQPYTVGENGRELFVPTTPGRIVPNGKLGGGNMQVVINNNSGSQVSAKQTQGPQGPRLQVQIDEMVASALASGSKTGDVLKNLQRNRMGGR